MTTVQLHYSTEQNTMGVNVLLFPDVSQTRLYSIPPDSSVLCIAYFVLSLVCHLHKVIEPILIRSLLIPTPPTLVLFVFANALHIPAFEVDVNESEGALHVPFPARIGTVVDMAVVVSLNVKSSYFTP